MSAIKRRSLLRDDSGAAAVEFAIVSTVFFSLVSGVLYLGLMLFTNLSVHWAVERAGRLAMINPAVTQTAVASAVNDYLVSIGLPSATVTYTVQAGAIPTAHINATLERSYTVPLVSTFDITYVADAYVTQGVL
jgi:Flp pilus assembly protein TadG